MLHNNSNVYNHKLNNICLRKWNQTIKSKANSKSRNWIQKPNFLRRLILDLTFTHSRTALFPLMEICWLEPVLSSSLSPVSSPL